RSGGSANRRPARPRLPGPVAHTWRSARSTRRLSLSQTSRTNLAACWHKKANLCKISGDACNDCDHARAACIGPDARVPGGSELLRRRARARAGERSVTQPGRGAPDDELRLEEELLARDL